MWSLEKRMRIKIDDQLKLVKYIEIILFNPVCNSI